MKASVIIDSENWSDILVLSVKVSVIIDSDNWSDIFVLSVIDSKSVLIGLVNSLDNLELSVIESVNLSDILILSVIIG